MKQPIKTDFVRSHYFFERQEPLNIKYLPWIEEEIRLQKRDHIIAAIGIIFFIVVISIPFWK